MEACWSNTKKKLQQGHFTRRSNKINQYTVSKVIDNIRKEPVIMIYSFGDIDL